MLVEDKEHDADEQEEEKLAEDDRPARQQGDDGLARGPTAEIPLNHELVGPVRRRREECSSHKARPEGVTAAPLPGEIEKSELVKLLSDAHDLAPAAGNALHDDQSGDNRPRDVDEKLNDIGPDDGLHPPPDRYRRSSHRR